MKREIPKMIAAQIKQTITKRTIFPFMLRSKLMLMSIYVT